MAVGEFRNRKALELSGSGTGGGNPSAHLARDGGGEAIGQAGSGSKRMKPPEDCLLLWF